MFWEGKRGHGMVPTVSTLVGSAKAEDAEQREDNGGCDIEEGQCRGYVMLALHSPHAGVDTVRHRGCSKSSPRSKTCQEVFVKFLTKNPLLFCLLYLVPEIFAKE